MFVKACSVMKISLALKNLLFSYLFQATSQRYVLAKTQSVTQNKAKKYGSTVQQISKS
jgi:hypothetical protein